MDSDTLEHQVEEALIRFGKKFSRASMLLEGLINAVDETDFTCTINVQTRNSDGTAADTLYYKVPLKVLIGSQAGFIEVPKVGTDCLMNFKDNNIQRPQLFWANELSKILISIGGQTLAIDSDGFNFNTGQLGFNLKDNLVDKINNIENDINSLKNAFTSWTPSSETGLKTAVTTWSGSKLDVTNKDDVVNKNIKQ